MRKTAATAVASVFRNAQEDEAESSGEDGEVTPPIIAPIPIPRRGSSNDDVEAPLLDAMKRTRDDPAKFEEYVRNRPAEPKPNDESFKQVPVEAFGKAMLQGMGYREENEVKPYLLDGRPSLLGLGAKPKLDDSRNAKYKRVYLTLGSVGQIEGTHRFAVVSQVDGVPGLDMIRVRTPGIAARGEDENKLMEIDLPRKHFVQITDLTNLGESHPLHRVISMNQRKETEDAQRANEALSSKRRKMQEQAEAREDDEHWTCPGLRVLYVDDKNRDHYKKKGVILQAREGRCDVRLDKDRSIVLQRVKEKYLQTVVPDKPGSKIMVVAGKHRGEVCELLEKDKSKDRALVKLSSNQQESFRLDDICEIATEINA